MVKHGHFKRCKFTLCKWINKVVHCNAICNTRVYITTRAAHAADIYKFPITCFSRFYISGRNNEFINFRIGFFFLTRTNVFNRYSCLHDKSNCNRSDEDWFVTGENLHFMQIEIRSASLMIVVGSCWTSERKRALRERWWETYWRTRKQGTMALMVLTSYPSYSDGISSVTFSTPVFADRELVKTRDPRDHSTRIRQFTNQWEINFKHLQLPELRVLYRMFLIISI